MWAIILNAKDMIFQWALYHEKEPRSLHSEIDKIHLSIEAQCGTAYLPMGDCHTSHRLYVLVFDGKKKKNCIPILAHNIFTVAPLNLT